MVANQFRIKNDHSLERYTIHAGKSIPNIWTIGHSLICLDNVYAIEPFVTTNVRVSYEGKVRIFWNCVAKTGKDQKADDFLEYL
jgi:methionyl aminopeptidase